MKYALDCGNDKVSSKVAKFDGDDAGRWDYWYSELYYEALCEKRYAYKKSCIMKTGSYKYQNVHEAKTPFFYQAYFEGKEIDGVHDRSQPSGYKFQCRKKKCYRIGVQMKEVYHTVQGERIIAVYIQGAKKEVFDLVDGTSQPEILKYYYEECPSDGYISVEIYNAGADPNYYMDGLTVYEGK